MMVKEHTHIAVCDHRSFELHPLPLGYTTTITPTPSEGTPTSTIDMPRTSTPTPTETPRLPQAALEVYFAEDTPHINGTTVSFVPNTNQPARLSCHLGQEEYDCKLRCGADCYAYVRWASLFLCRHSRRD